jgi:hypothetical protein
MNPNINIELGTFLSVPQVEMARLSKMMHQFLHDLDLWPRNWLACWNSHEPEHKCWTWQVINLVFVANRICWWQVFEDGSESIKMYTKCTTILNGGLVSPWKWNWQEMDGRSKHCTWGITPASGGGTNLMSRLYWRTDYWIDSFFLYLCLILEEIGNFKSSVVHSCVLKPFLSWLYYFTLPPH